MKIALISGTLPPYPCGVGKHTSFLAGALTATGYNVTVFTLDNPEVGERPTSYRLEKFLRKFSLPEYFRLAKKLRSENFDLIHLEYPTKLNKRGVSVIALPWIMKLFGLKTVLTLHELSGSSLFGKIRNILLSVGFDHIILTNPADRKFLKFLDHKVVEIALGPHLSRSLGGNQKINGRVAHLGYLDGSKGEELLIEVFQDLGKDLSLEFLTTFQKDNAHHNDLKLMIKKAGLSNRASFLNPKSESEITDALDSAEMAVLPFRGGVSARNSTLIEALSFNLPTVVTIGKESPKYLKDGDNCLFTKEDSKSLGEEVIRLHSNPALQEQISRGAKTLAKNFDWGEISRQTALVYQEVMK